MRKPTLDCFDDYIPYMSWPNFVPGTSDYSVNHMDRIEVCV